MFSPSGTRTAPQAFLDLELPDGTVVRAEIAHADFENHVFPLLGGVPRLA